MRKLLKKINSYPTDIVESVLILGFITIASLLERL